MQITPDSLWYYLVVFLIYGNIFALVLGVLMLAVPGSLSALFKFSNRWISTRQLTKPLEKPRSTERAMLRYPRVLGAILLASAALILVKGTIFITDLSVADGAGLLARLYGDTGISAGVWESLWICLIAFIVLGVVMAIVVGLMSLFQLGQLKHWAEAANRWVSSRRATKPLDTPHYHLDRMIMARPRLWGGLISALAVFSILVLWVFVLGA
ncbi:MAG: hypothetical protein OEM83_00575 [Gammaproteobacteria bacterium]|nr:hypothetical protein [Gammaproteobacteria bacterium]